MKNLLIVILISVFVYSCNDKPAQKNNSQKKKIPEKTIANSDQQTSGQIQKAVDISNPELLKAFLKAAQHFPKDSASIYRFYIERNSTNDKEKQKKQIKRLNKLTSEASKERYRTTQTNLKPLLTRIVTVDKMNKAQVDSVVVLYSNYDYFSGESLFSDYFNGDENYSLVWQSFRIMVQESKKDTSFISGLIKLDKNIRTNVELAEAMQDFIVEAIRNNPIGFLLMYGNRQQERRKAFANHISVWDAPDKELVDKYNDISKNSDNEKYRNLATDLLEKIQNQY